MLLQGRSCCARERAQLPVVVSSCAPSPPRLDVSLAISTRLRDDCHDIELEPQNSNRRLNENS